MSRETSLWNWLKKSRIELRDELHINRIENSLGKGTPDVEGYLYYGGQFWIELKSSERPKYTSTPIRFKVKDREAQVEWMRRRTLVGGNTWLLLQVGSGHVAKRYLVLGKYATEIYAGVNEKRLRELTKLSEVKPTPSDVVKRAAKKSLSRSE